MILRRVLQDDDRGLGINGLLDEEPGEFSHVLCFDCT